MTRAEIQYLPIGQVLDQIDCWKISALGAKEKHRNKGSLFEQMSRYSGR